MPQERRSLAAGECAAPVWIGAVSVSQIPSQPFIWAEALPPHPKNRNSCQSLERQLRCLDLQLGYSPFSFATVLILFLGGTWGKPGEVTALVLDYSFPKA